MPQAASRRASTVCHNCHQRKIKCDIYITGSPCTKCTETGGTCEARTRKSYTSRQRGTKVIHELSEPEARVVAAAAKRYKSKPRNPEPATGSDDDRDEVVANAISFGNSGIPNSETTPLFVGDRQGIGALLDATHPDSTKNRRQHLMIPKTAAKLLQPEDLEYLKAKGCFSLPSKAVCNALIESYFLFVHPSFPIIDTQDFLDGYNRYGVQRINLLLLWSMFSISASYIDDRVLETTSYVTRKSFKEDIIRRAKLLYDISYENDKIILIQSALLLSFWFVDAEDVKQSWYWTGIAISISQTIGLHRNPDANRTNSALSDRQRRLWRNLWWSCMLRDGWLAVGMGRPMRLNSGDCDCPMPTLHDTEFGFKEVVLEGKDLLSSDAQQFASVWMSLLKVSEGLRDCLSVRYSSHYERPFASRVENLKSDVGPQLEMATTTSPPTSEALRVAISHLHLHQKAAQIALFRPDTDAFAIGKVQEAATTINSILESSMADGTVIFTAPVAIPLIVPAMHTHLIASRSKVLLANQLGAHKLGLCLMFLQALENNYPAAAIVRRLFTTLQSKIKPNGKIEGTATQQSDSAPTFSPDSAELGNTRDTQYSGSLNGSEDFMSLPTQDSFWDIGEEEGLDPYPFFTNYNPATTQNLDAFEDQDGAVGYINEYASLL